ncbi:MAG: divergent polysaccharide deacetylase family protein [Dialister pneumosintes]|jgi:Uncharacterized protein conserved in bacteria
MSYRKKRRISLRKKRKGNFLKLFIFLTAILLSVYYFWGTDSGVIPQVKDVVQSMDKNMEESPMDSLVEPQLVNQQEVVEKARVPIEENDNNKKRINKTPVKLSGVKMAICIDDAGRDLETQSAYEELGVPITLAVMPNESYTREAAASWHAKGLPVIIHQPMESISGVGMEPIVLLTQMDENSIRKMIRESIRQIPEARGMNNHQGSKATADFRVMDIVMSEMASQNMFFFDSATNSVTEVAHAADMHGVLHARNNLFVDNSSDVDDICQMIREAADRAKKNGQIIIIGHCRPNTVTAFQKMIPQLQEEGIEFVSLSDLVQ